MEKNKVYIRPYKYIYDSKPHNERLAAFVFSHLNELRAACMEHKPTSRAVDFDDLFLDTVCIYVTSSTPDTAPDDVKLAAFVRAFHSYCITAVHSAMCCPEQRMLERDGSHLDGFDE